MRRASLSRQGLESYIPENLLLTFESKSNVYSANLVFLTEGRISKMMEMDVKSILHPEELHYFNKVTLRRKKTYIAGRFAAKSALMAFGKASINKIHISSGAFGHPVVQPYCCRSIGATISHTDTQAIAISYPLENPVAVDIENIDTKNAETMKSQMTHSDIELTQDSDLPEVIRITALWCAKESISKIIKSGLLMPFSLFAISTFQYEHRWINIEYRYFKQYRTSLWVMSDAVVAITYPRIELLKNTSEIFHYLSGTKKV